MDYISFSIFFCIRLHVAPFVVAVIVIGAVWNELVAVKLLLLVFQAHKFNTEIVQDANEEHILNLSFIALAFVSPIALPGERIAAFHICLQTHLNCLIPLNRIFVFTRIRIVQTFFFTVFVCPFVVAGAAGTVATSAAVY